MASAPSNRRCVELLTESIVASPLGPRAAVWESIERELGTPRKSFSLGQERRRSSLVRVAALVLVAGAGALGGRALFRAEPELATPVSPMRVVTTPPGQRASFRLPDGTSVMLGVASTLRHPMSFGVGGREVHLEGEAYFEVVHQDGRPFVVRAGDVIAEELGTEFIVRAYPEDRQARVVVREGQVAVRAADSSVATAGRVLLPGQSGRLDTDGRPVVESADTSAYFAWTEGRLVFDDIPLRDALPQLSRWFDLEFLLADSALGQMSLTATFKNQPTADALDLLAASLGMRQVRGSRTVTFYPGTGIR
ncbi:MAG: FecR domain-containing protein [Gemmatimonadales bacterium]|nr:FecR domain-containing protein [Gemmatimonadales bacterium]